MWTGTQAAPGRSGHVLLNEDLHQVDVATRSCRVQGRPQLVVLGVHVRTVGKQQLDNLFKVVNAALGGTQRQSEVRHGPCPGGDTPHTPHKRSQEGRRETEPEFESSCVASVLEVLPVTSGEALYLLEKLIMRKLKIASANGPVSSKVFL